MAEVGKNAKFYDFGGGAKQDGGDLLTGVLKNLPQLFAQVDLENQALNGEEITETVKKLFSAVAEPFKQAEEAKAQAVQAGEAARAKISEIAEAASSGDSSADELSDEDLGIDVVPADEGDII